MNNLKTLKDLKLRGNSREYDLWSEDLKAEAIKWVNDCSGTMEWKDRNDYEIGQCVGCKWFIKFFNITEEELKNEK